MQETQQIQVQSLGQEDPLDEEMATHSSILAWKIPWTEEPGGLQSMGSQRSGHDERLSRAQHLILWIHYALFSHQGSPSIPISGYLCCFQLGLI